MTATPGDLSFEPYGDSALIVARVHDDQTLRWAAARTIGAAVREACLPGVEGVVSAYDTLLIEFDPLTTSAGSLRRWILEQPASRVAAAPATTGIVHEIPLVYGGAHGPDLAAVAAVLDLSVEDVVERHAATPWRVAFNGAPPGAPMHEGSPFDRPIPRLSEPRARITAGSVALAGFQGTIYTIPAPGGWQLIGRTPLRIIDPDGEPFVAIAPGDTLRFRPISEREFAATPPRFLGDVR